MVHVRTRYSNISRARLVIESGDYFVQHVRKYVHLTVPVLF